MHFYKSVSKDPFLRNLRKKNTSLALQLQGALSAPPYRLQHLTVRLIQNGRGGLEIG